MKLVAFNVLGTAQNVYINPAHVIAVRSNLVGSSVVILSDGSAYTVAGDQDEVAQVLMRA